MAEPLLLVEDLKSGYGRVAALKGVGVAVAAGEIVCLVGANGAGKTTFLRALSGVQPCWSGRILFEGRDVSRASAHARVAAGIAQAPEGRQVFAPLSVEDNLRLGAFRRGRAETETSLAEAYAMFPVLAERRRDPAGGLSGGQQQMLAIARALMSRPKLLLLDEPSLGLAPVLVDQVFETIADLKRRGVTVLLVEQNAAAALAVADRGYVMETGRVELSGSGKSLLADDRVREAYLGV
jgi:branched-chain amino acid transport system ATP-binding protein